MKSKPSLSLPVLLLLACPMAAQARSDGLTSNDLIERAKELHGKEVVYTGEAIGDAMRRGDHSWVNVNDGSNAVGIWLDETQIAAIRIYGSYNEAGDLVRIRGTFHRSCPEHGGDIDIHALEVAIVKPGGPTGHEVKNTSIILAAVLLPISLGLLMAWRRKDRH